MCGLWVWSCCPHLNLFESIFERTYRLMMNEIQRRVQLSRVIINIFTWRNGCPSSPTWDVILMNEKYVSIQLCNKHACCTWNLYLPWKDESAISSNFSVQVELSNWRVHWRSITLGADMTTRVSCFLSSSLRLDFRHTHLVMTIYYMQKSYPTPRRNESSVHPVWWFCLDTTNVNHESLALKITFQLSLKLSPPPKLLQ